MPTRTTGIAGHDFEVNQPYAAGHVISEIEAKVLNQTRAENVGNNMRATVKEMLEKNESLDAIRAKIAEYDAQYNFSMGGGGGRAPIDPLEKEIRRLAKAMVHDSIRANGKKLKDYTDEQLEGAYDRAAQRDDVRAEAQKNLKAAQKRAKASAEELGLAL